MRATRSRLTSLTALAAGLTLALAVLAPSAFGTNDKAPGSGTPRAGSVSGPAAQSEPVQATSAIGGPIVIMGIDAEDGGVGGHGPASVYISVLQSVITNTTNGGSGILVIGGNKSPTDDVTEFWNEVTTGASITPTYVNGAANIATQSFVGFKVIAVVSGDGETFSGGLTAAESEALALRQAAVAAFVNAGGGLMAFAQDFTGSNTSAYGFLGDIGSFTFTTELDYDDIAPTPSGTAIGITDALDVCCWHDVYLTYPSFLAPLALANSPEDSGSYGKVAALGGIKVTIGPEPQPVPEPEPKPEPAFTG